MGDMAEEHGKEEEGGSGGSGMIDKIIDEVYVSGAGALVTETGRQELTRLGITHVLTVSAMPVPHQPFPSLTYKFLYAMDSPVQDLLGTEVIPNGVAFIEAAAREGGKVLVHCEVGVSRSVTVVAAYLMKRFSWTHDKAITHIQIRRPIACPNDGFIAQLRIYRKLGYKVDRDSLMASPDYRNWCVESGNLPESGKDPRASMFVRDLEATKGDEGKEAKGNKFRCRKCRETLFYAKHIVRHERTGRGAAQGEMCDFGYFIEPLTWMDTSEYQGKIGCPKCGEKLGSYCWGGKACQGDVGKPCRTQVQPWVHIHKTKVDEARSVSVAFAPEVITATTSAAEHDRISSASPVVTH